MFTGLVEDIGEIVAIRPEGAGKRLTLRTGIALDEVEVGASIAVDGACLTVTHIDRDRFTVVAARETMAHTTLASVRVGRRVHLERALVVGGRLDGHIVQGHVDGVGTVRRSESASESHVLWVKVPTGVARYIASKGSICINGVSLTVNELDGSRFRVNLVPLTTECTLLGALRPGDTVNIEVDVLAKYVERLLGSAQPGNGLSLETLIRNGYA